MGRSYTSRNSNSKAVHIHHEVTDYFKPSSIKYYTGRFIKNQQKYAKLIQVFTMA